MALVECVPNFSEGRDPAVLASIVAAMAAVPDVYVLAQEMDADHHRAVVTLAGEPEAVAEAAVRGVGEAARHIDLRRHHGAHPRVGAADVVPFVPLENTTLADCVRLAEWAGAEIWRRFHIPVYLYEAAARTPERVPLEAVRRGQFEGLSEEVKVDPTRLPDFGPPFAEAALHPSAGATVVGARKFLIAYNINLDTDRVEVARAIARSIRTSGGGLPALKAIGIPLDNPPRAQVSMNLTDFEQTSLATVWRAVETEAERRGVRIAESELIGLAPAAALENAVAELLKLRVFDPGRIIENRLLAVRGAVSHRRADALHPLLRQLAAGDPSGAEAAAAATAALAAALAHPAETGNGGVETAGEAATSSSLEDWSHTLARHADDARLAEIAWRAASAEDAAGQAGAATGLAAASVHRAEVSLALAVEIQGLLHRLTAMDGSASGRVAPPAAIELARTAGQIARSEAHRRLMALPAHLPQRRHLWNELQRLEGIA